MKKRFKAEILCDGHKFTRIVEVEEPEYANSIYSTNDTSYIIDDVNGERLIVPRIKSIITVKPLIVEVIYRENNEDQGKPKTH